MNKDVSRVAGSRSLVGEPTATADKDSSFMTGNWWAAVSKNGGGDWSYINPYTKFAAPDGAFCCDQYSIFIPKWGLSVWLLQYGYSKTTKSGGYRIAFADRASLRKGIWWSYYFRPKDMGFSNKTWLDFPHLAFTDNYLYFTAWVFAGEAGGEWGKILAKLPLKPISQKKGFGYSIWPLKRSQPSWRMAFGGTHTLYFGDHLSTSKFRIWRWKETQNVIRWEDRNHALFYSGPKLSPGPDGRKWMSRVSVRPMGAWVAKGVIGFLWCSAQGGSYPKPFVRVLRFRESDRKLLNEQTVWNKDYAFAYPTVSVNSRGHLGGSMAIGGKGVYPTTLVWISDDLHGSFQPLDVRIVGMGNSGPVQPVWGDYFSSIPHSLAPNSWVGTGNLLRGGPNGSNQQCTYTWFGRSRDLPNRAGLLVLTSGAPNGVQISVEPKDLAGNASGVAPFARFYVPQQEVKLSAPKMLVKTQRFLFSRWNWNGTLQAAGLRTLQKRMSAQPSSTKKEYAIAQYTKGWLLWVQSLNPSKAVPIQVSAQDHNGQKDGLTPMSRIYRDQQNLLLQAPAKMGLNPLKRWIVDGKSVVPSIPYKLSLRMDRDHYVTVEYAIHTQGWIRSFGQSCPTGTQVNLHVGSATANEPVLGGKLALSLRKGTGTPLLLSLGFSKTKWGGFRLPLDLKTIGAPGCFVYQSLENLWPTRLDLRGNVDVILPIPNSPAFLGAKIYSQYLIPSNGKNPLGWYLSNGLETRIGGNR